MDEYLDASNRESARTLHVLAERLEKYGFDSGHLLTEHSFREFAEDTPERIERDRETVDAWCTAQGLDRAAEVYGAKVRLLARLAARS